MKRKYAFVLAVLLLPAACVPLTEKPPTSAPAPASVEQGQAAPSVAQELRVKGPAAVEQLKGWYNQTAINCGTATRPAFLCSGVMLRGTLSRQTYLPWDPSQNSIDSGGVSFAWIRTDTNFKELPLNYNNGFIFYPVFDTPAGKNSHIEVMCAFPYDGWTDIRNQQGCGTNTAYPTHSRPCNEQNINTGVQWINHFNAAPDKYKAQCGWNVREGQANTADRFYQSIDGRSRITSKEWYGNNELRLATWARGSGAQLPIQSFFYVAGTAGLASAQDDQRRYFENYKQVVPVIQLTFAADKNTKAAFVYRDSDQGVGGGGGSPEIIDFESLPLQEGKREIVVPQGRLFMEGGTAGTGLMAIKNKTPPNQGIAGHHLFTTAKLGDYTFPTLELVTPVSRFSFDSVHLAGFCCAEVARVVFTDDSEVDPPSAFGTHYDYIAPSGKKIKKISIHGVPAGTEIDNITLYE